SRTLALAIPAGTADASFSYSDTLAGAPTITASLAGQPAAQQTVNVLPAPIATIAVAPKAATLTSLRTKPFTPAARDVYGNPVTPTTRGKIGPRTPGKLRPATGGRTTFTAAQRAGKGTVVAVAGAFSATARVTVKKGAARVSSIRYTSSRGRLV